MRADAADGTGSGDARPSRQAVYGVFGTVRQVETERDVVQL